MKALAAVAALVAIALAPAAAAAQECPQTSLAAVEAEVMCPVCGTPLGLAAEAPQAERQRALIQRLVDRCRSKEEIKDALVGQYGSSVLALPEPKGFKLGAYVVPALALLIAAVAIAVAARRWRQRGSDPDGDAAPAGDAAARDRLDADLKRYEL